MISLLGEVRCSWYTGCYEVAGLHGGGLYHSCGHTFVMLAFNRITLTHHRIYHSWKFRSIFVIHYCIPVRLQQISGKKPSAREAKEHQRDWGVRKGEPIGVAVTVRGEDAVVLLKRLFEAKGNQVKEKSFDNFGNYSFGINEHIDIPGVKYDPKIGI